MTIFFRYALTLIFGMWVYNDELQIKFTFHSDPMIFDRVMALGLWNLAKYLVVTTLYHYDLRYWLDFWYVSVLWCVTNQVWISFRLNDFGLIYAPWTFNFGQIFSCHHFISLWFEILTSFLVFGITIMSYRSSFIGIGLLIHMQVL